MPCCCCPVVDRWTEAAQNLRNTFNGLTGDMLVSFCPMASAGDEGARICSTDQPHTYSVICSSAMFSLNCESRLVGFPATMSGSCPKCSYVVASAGVSRCHLLPGRLHCRVQGRSCILLASDLQEGQSSGGLARAFHKMAVLGNGRKAVVHMRLCSSGSSANIAGLLPAHTPVMHGILL
jgi:hypothetical protein